MSPTPSWSAVLRRAGYAAAAGPEDADVILLNTCAIREHAEERVLRRLSELARFKHARPELRLGLLGCMAQHNRAALVEKAPWLDLVAGPDSYRRLPELLGRARFDPARQAANVDVRLDRCETYADIAPAHERGVRAYVTAMRGCDQFLRVLRGAVRARARAQRAARGDLWPTSAGSPRAACARSCCSGRR